MSCLDALVCAIPLARPSSGALSAIALPGVPASVDLVERMTVLARSFGGVLRRNTCASQDVSASRDLLKVERVNAGPIAAQVVELKVVADRSEKAFVGVSVGVDVATVEPKESISVAQPGGPDPTVLSFTNLAPEAFLDDAHVSMLTHQEAPNYGSL